MKITNKTICRVVTNIITSMLFVSVITSGFTGKVSFVLYGALIMALFYDDLASWEYRERNGNNVSKSDRRYVEKSLRNRHN